MKIGSEEKKRARKKDLKGKYPLGYLLELKDLVYPITIKRIQLIKAGILIVFLGAVAYVVWEEFIKAPSGEELIAEMVEASGGTETWKSIKHGSFKRTHRLFDNTGKLLSEQTETFYFNKDGQLKFMLDVESPAITPVTIGKDSQGFWALQDNELIDAESKARELGFMCDSKWCSPDCNMSMAFFRFSMPFKLQDNGVIAENGGLNQLKDQKLQQLDISYDPEVGRDKWVFFTSPEDHLIRKMEYHHYNDEGVNKPEELFWSDYKEIAGLKISTRWTRYWSNGQVLEEYTFSDFDFNSDLPDSFDKRPEIASLSQ